MKRKNNSLLIIVIVVVMALIALLVIFIPSGNKHYSWRENYLQSSSQPFGTMVVSELLKDYFPDENFTLVRNDLAATLNHLPAGHKNYVFIGQKPYLTDSTYGLIRDFVYEGNDAFFAVNEIPEKLSNGIFKNTLTEQLSDSTFYLTDFGDTIWYQKPEVYFDKSALSFFTMENMSMNFNSDAFKRDSSFSFEFKVQDESTIYKWKYIFPQYAESLIHYDSLGTVRSQNFLNYIRIPYGQGNFYIHTNPIVFTNFFQIKENNIEYTSKVFSYLMAGDIIWDESSKTMSDSSGEGMDFNSEREGPLKYILSQPALRWAWYTLIAGVVLFLIFRSKRMQQPIPVMEPNENKSLEFIQTIGRMYFISRNHKLIAQQKMKLFLHFINDRYRLPTNELNDKFFATLNLKSEISPSEIKSIFTHYRFMENTLDVTPDDLIYFHQLLDSFYKNCK